MKFACLAVAVSTLLGQLATPALTVRVDASGGAPRLMVNGQPVRARMFFGIQQAAPLTVAPDKSDISFEFTAAESEPATATMHFRFGQAPGEIFLDNIRVTDLGTNRDVIPLRDFEHGAESFAQDWTYWPPDAQNTVGTIRVDPGVGQGGSAGLHVSLRAPANGQWPDFHIYHQPRLALVQGHRYRVSFWMRVDRPREVRVAFYRPGSTFVFLGGPPGYFESQIKLAAGAGVNFVSFPIGLPWPAPGQAADWAGVDNTCAAVLAANPRALLVPRIPMDPPAWWQQAHPGDVMRWEDNKSHRGVAVVSSPVYRHDAGARLQALVGHVEAKFGEHVAGYHPAGQNTGEWFYEDTWGGALSGYAPADEVAWRQWLALRYHNDAALRQAWQDDAVTLATVTVPSASARHVAPAGSLRDPIRERAIIDFTEFRQVRMADCVRVFASVVRQATWGRKLVLFFYGYGFEFGAVHSGAATSGHYALRRVLNSPDIDVLCAPISYFDRGRDGGAPSMSAAESVALAGKMWLNEDDTATYLSSGDAPGSTERVTTLADTNAQLTRNVGQEALRNFATWWMDLGASGWFNDPGMWNLMARLNALEAPLLRRPVPFRPQVAAVLDERSMCYAAEGGELVTRPAIYEVRKPLGRMGAPYGQYLLDDVLAGRVHAKLYVFLNAWALSAAQRAQLLRRTQGSTRIWCYAPGYLDEQGASTSTSPSAMHELTGFTLQPVTPGKAWATPTEVGKKLGLTQSFGVDKPVRPLFAAVDAKPDEVLATYPEGATAIALRRGPGGPSLFVGVPGLTPQLLRVAARSAGVHLFTQSDCYVYANGPFLVLHAAQDGSLLVDTGTLGQVQDVLSGQLLGRGPRFPLVMQHGQTRVLRY